MEIEPSQTKREEHKKIVSPAVLFVVLLLLTVGSVFVFLFTHQKHQPTAVNGRVSGGPLPRESMVVLSDSGFRPQTLTISKGTSVRWYNQSGSDNASVNSDNYPTNRLYPELNLGKFAKGQTLAHIFTTPGTYTYHNQYQPSDKGTIIVK